MRRILITSKVLQIANDYADEVKLKNRKGAIDRLKTQLLQQGINEYTAYLDWVLTNYDALLRKPLSYFNINIPPHLTQAQLSREVFAKFSYQGSTKEFYKHLATAMGYNLVRNQIYPKYVKRLGIKACVYCNAQYGVTIHRSRGDFSSTYEVDHFKPQSKEPHLCTSFFNFQPSCSHCNKSKNNKVSQFNLYTEDKNALNPFYFCLDSLSLVNFLVTGDEEHLSIRLKSNSEPLLLNNHKNIFHIDEKYSNHKDEVARLILKTGYYNSAYMQQLKNEFRILFPKMPYPFEELILGFPISKSAIHRKPLTLMLQDIARDFRFI